MALFQDAVLAKVSLLGGRLDLVLLVVAGWAFLRGSIEGAVWGFIGGFILDLFSGGPFGGLTLCLTLVGLFVGRRWWRELGSVYLQLALLILIAGFTYHLLLLLILSWTGHTVGWVYSLSRVAAPSAVLNAAVAPFVYWPLAWLNRKTRPEGFTLEKT